MGRRSRGSLYKRGDTFWLEYQAGGQRFRQSLGVTTKKEAEKERDRIMAPLSLGTEAERRKAVAVALQSVEEQTAVAVEAAKQGTPIAEAWDRWPYVRSHRGSAERDLSETSIRDNRQLWARFERWAETVALANMEDVTDGHATAFREALIAEGLSGHRVNLAILTARVMFDAAGTTPNPFAGIRKRQHVAKGRRELTTEELQTVCQAAAGELRTLLALGLYGGLRLGDAACLDWSEVSPDLGTIQRLASKTAYKGQVLTIPVHPVLCAILAETPEKRRRGPVLPELATLYVKDKAAVSKRIQAHFEGCGVRTQKEGTGYTTDAKGKRVYTGKRAVVEVGFHSLRHAFVSLAARAGIPLHVVRELVGHASPAVQRIYLHVTGEDARRAVLSLPDVAARDSGDMEARRRLAELAMGGSMTAVREALKAFGD